MNTGKLSNTGFVATSGDVVSSIERMAKGIYDKLDGKVDSLIIVLDTYTGDYLLACRYTWTEVLRGHSEAYTQALKSLIESFNN